MTGDGHRALWRVGHGERRKKDLKIILRFLDVATILKLKFLFTS